MARRRFFADRMEGGRAWVLGAHARHLAQVLRAAVGQQFELAWQGAVYDVTVTAARRDQVEFAVLQAHPAPALRPQRVVAAALFKFDRWEWMLEKATELGASAVQPLTTQRADKRLISAAEGRQERWRAILLGAAEQSRRASVPELRPMYSLPAFLESSFCGERLWLDEEGGAPLLGTVGGQDAVVLSGPEGGWTPEERATIVAAGFAPRGLGPGILRCETAICAALARLLA